jgi:hypothetical protein
MGAGARWVTVTTVALAALSLGLPASAVAGSAGTWGKAQQIRTPRTGSNPVKKNLGGISSVSCAKAGECGAVGFYIDPAGKYRGYVVSQKNGAWGKIEAIPGTAALNPAAFADATLNVISCAAPGDCSAGGSYIDAGHEAQLFVVSEKNGTWGKAKAVPGLAALNTGGDSQLTALSCVSPGNCAASGDYAGDHPSTHSAFVVDQVNGSWGKAQAIPGMTALNTGGEAFATSVSCGAVGICAAVGSYTLKNGVQRAFVASEWHGKWGDAVEAPNLERITSGRFASLSSVSCTSGANCAAVGFSDRPNSEPFFIVELHGRWGSARELHGTVSLNGNAGAALTQVSCHTLRGCSAAGTYVAAGGRSQPFVVFPSKDGVWSWAKKVSGLAALDHGLAATVTSLSCGAAGGCSAAGYANVRVSAKLVRTEAFVVSERKSVWGNAQVVPGIVSLDKEGNSKVSSLSCASASQCSAGGSYELNHSGSALAFVVSQG